MDESLKDIIQKFRLSSGIKGCERLIDFIQNIIKWIKYVLPVLVIVLSIIDFIKAIGSDKDDEMKKAQSNFVKRLIGAALLFLVPLIIELILEKMGFSSNSCGLW